MFPAQMTARFATLACSLILLLTAVAARGAASDGGIISGRVSYKADAARPWQYGRYYIASARDGWLAEAVVALEGPGLPMPAVSPTTHWMDQKNFAFIPETLVIRAGDSVRFTNSDEAPHNVMTFQGPAPLNINLAQDKEHIHLFPEGKGLNQPILLTCVFHTAMRGWVFVFPHFYYVLTGKDGQFRFEKVPSGDYVLRVMHPAGELEWSRPVTVKGGAPVEISVALSPDQKKK